MNISRRLDRCEARLEQRLLAGRWRMRETIEIGDEIEFHPDLALPSRWGVQGGRVIGAAPVLQYLRDHGIPLDDMGPIGRGWLMQTWARGLQGYIVHVEYPLLPHGCDLIVPRTFFTKKGGT